MNTIENNKTIAEFMGFEIAFGDTSEPCVMSKQSTWTPIKYHSDWNWLMQVVEKIESFTTSYNGSIYNVIIESVFVEVINNVNSEIIVKVSANTKIEAVYNACVEFIKWYNEQKN